MRKYIRYVLRGNEGLRDYLKFLGTVLGALFVVYLLLLVILISEGSIGSRGDSYSLMMYELFGSCAGGVACATMTDHLLRISVSAGVSRESFLRAHLRLMPLFAVITTVMIALAIAVTDGLFHLTGNACNSIAAEVFYHIDMVSQYQPRVIMFNLTVIFCLVMFYYSVALMYAGFKNRINLTAGVIAAGLMGMIGISNRGYFLYLLDATFEDSVDLKWRAAQAQYIQLPPDHFWFSLLEFAAAALLWYLIIYGIFSLLTARVPVRGKEQEGAI